jgi:hypothetical protein
MGSFNYRAHACALGGRITFPSLRYIPPQAYCELPPEGGRVENHAGPYRLEVDHQFVLSFESAETEITGVEKPEKIHTTTVTTTLHRLNVRDVLKADAIVSRIQLVYDTAAGKVAIDTKGSRYENLTIGGEPFNVVLDHDLSREASDIPAFRARRSGVREQNGKLRHFLGQHPKLQGSPTGGPHHHHPGFGRIYFGEWMAAPNTQSLTVLRLQLGCPVEGDVDIGGGEGNGGPPG